MRTKDEILSCVIKDVETSRNLLEMEHVTDVPLLEVLIDIRDILNEMLIAKGESPLDTLLKS